MSQPLVALVRRATTLVDSTVLATDVIRLMLGRATSSSFR
jgi:hypothetical protein